MNRRLSRGATALIERIELNETDLIIGQNFPTRNEDRFLEEAAGERIKAGSAQNSGAVTFGASKETQAKWSGLGAHAQHEHLGTWVENHDAQHQIHMNLAGWYELGAQNIRATKLAMNETCEQYHRDYAKNVDLSTSDGWPQSKLAEVKRQLVSAAQTRIAELSKACETSHQQIAAGILAGSTPVRPAEMTALAE